MTKAIILAAGEGSRLKPLTNNLPKCLVKFLGKSLLDYQIDAFNKLNIKKIHIVSGYKEEKIFKKNLSKSINKNYKNSNMVNSLFSCVDFFEGEEDIIISYGDIIFTKENLKKVLSCKKDISLMIDINFLEYWKVRSQYPLNDLESLILDNEDYVKEIGRKVDSYEGIQGQYTGLIKLKGSSVNKIIKFYNQINKTKLYDGKNFDNMYMTSFLQLLINSGQKIKATKVRNGWLEFDTIEDYNIYNKLNKNEKLKYFFNYKT